MKILVPVKRVVDHNVKIRVLSDQSGIDLASVKMSINPFDEIAVEEALRQKEAGSASEVIVVSVGPKQAQEVLRTALAMGADRAILIETSDGAAHDIEPLTVAKLLATIATDEGVGLIITGKQAIDNDMNATGQMTAALLGWPQATCACELHVVGDHAQVAREIDGGQQVLRVRLPAVVTADLRLNEPRYASLPNIMKAKKKPLSERRIEDFDLNLTPRLKVVKIAEPKARAAGVKLASADELILKLKEVGAL